MPSLWFVVPVHGRAQLAQICLAQLRRTCDQLEEAGIRASAVVVGDDENLDTARSLGFAVVERDNRFLSRKFNDGIQLACDQSYNPYPADYVVPCGSDDFVHWELFTDLPDRHTMVGFPNLAFVREDGLELTATRLTYPGGAGIRIWPRHVLKRLGFRPADEDRVRGCDTSILINVQRAYPGLKIEHRETDPRWIVDWKTAGENVNEYGQVTARFRGESLASPFLSLMGLYPQEALDDMASHYGLPVMDALAA